MTWKLFITDTLKSLLIEVVIYNVFMMVVEFVIRLFGDSFFLYLWIAFISIMFILLAVYPIYIAPLFNKFESLDINNAKEKQL